MALEALFCLILGQRAQSHSIPTAMVGTNSPCDFLDGTNLPCRRSLRRDVPAIKAWFVPGRRNVTILGVTALSLPSSEPARAEDWCKPRCHPRMVSKTRFASRVCAKLIGECRLNIVPEAIDERIDCCNGRIHVSLALFAPDLTSFIEPKIHSPLPRAWSHHAAVSCGSKSTRCQHC